MPKWKLKQEIKSRLPLKLFLVVRTENNMIFSIWQIAPCLILWNKGERERAEHLVWNLLIRVVKGRLFHWCSEIIRHATQGSRVLCWLGHRTPKALPTCGSQEATAGAFHHPGDVATNGNPWMTLSWKQAWNCVQGFHLWVKLGTVDTGNLRKGRNLLLKLGRENLP